MGLQRDNFIVRAPPALRKRAYRKPADWENRTFSEKVAWRRRNPDPNVDYRMLMDKHLVKDVVAACFKTARPYAVVSEPDEIDADALPPTFVMKSTRNCNRSMLVVNGHFQGMNREKRMAGEHADTAGLRRLARQWQSERMHGTHREIQVRFVEPRILFEEYLSPLEYELQFFLFSGICRLTMLLKRSFDHSQGVRHRLYDQHWRRLEPGWEGCASNYDDSINEAPPPAPEVFEKLARICRHIDHVRVDFFVCGGELYFGEFTFTHNAGKPSLLGKHERELTRYWPDVTAV